MLIDKVIKVVIPAYNEQESLGKVVRDIPMGIVDEVVVVNNASSDLTEVNAKAAGATVVTQNYKGYGNACLKGIDYLKSKNEPIDVIVFMDADYSDYPEEIYSLLEPIFDHDHDLVIGSRVLGYREKGSLTPQQIFGNWLATRLVRLFYGVRFSDLGPFRAMKWEAFLKLGMKDKTYGWTVEMQVKAAKLKLKCSEIPVSYRRRIGVSKVSGTVKGTLLAGYKIIWTIFKNL